MSGRVYLIMGEAGTGKSTFALSGTGKTWVAEWDVGSFARTGKDETPSLTMKQYRSPLTNLLGPGRISVGPSGGIAPATVHVLAGWKEAFWQFVEDYLEVLGGDTQNIVVDTSTKLWLACRQGFLQEIQQAAGADRERLSTLQYTEPNARMDQIVEAAKLADKNLILISHEKEMYVNDKPSGVIIPDSYKQLPNLADCTLRFTLKDKKPQAHVYKAGTGGLELLNMVLEQPTLESVDELLTAASKLRRAGKPVPGTPGEVLLHAMRLGAA